MTTPSINVGGDRTLWTATELNLLRDGVAELQGIASGGSIPLNVRDYGAVGDGVTDDSTAINAAIAALPSNGGIVFFPLPTTFYYIASGIVDPGTPNVTLLGADGAPFGVSGSFGPPQTFAPCAIGSDVASLVLLTIGSSSSTDWRGWQVKNLTFFDSSAAHDQIAGAILLRRRNNCRIEAVHAHDIRAGYAFAQTGLAGNPQYTEFESVRAYNCLYGLQQQTKASDTRIMRSTFYGVNSGTAVRASSVGLDLDSTTYVDDETAIQFFETNVRIGNGGAGTGRVNRIGGAIETDSSNPGLYGVHILNGNDNVIDCDIANSFTTAKIGIDSGVLRTAIRDYRDESDDITGVSAKIVDSGTGTYMLGAVTGLNLGDNALALSVKSITSSPTLANRHYTCLADATGASRTVTLPSAVNCKGRLYLVKRVDGTAANIVTVATTSSQTIDGLASVVLLQKNDFVLVQSDGANWQVVAPSSPAGLLFAPQAPGYMGPDPRILGSSVAMPSINGGRATRRLVPVSGHITDVSIFINTSSGNIDVAIYDTTVTTRNKLWSTGSVAASATTTAWVSMGNPNLAVNRGDELDFCISADNTTFKIVAALFTGAVSQLPTGYHPAPKGAIPNLTWARGSSFVWPSTVAESGIATASGAELAIIATVTPS